MSHHVSLLNLKFRRTYHIANDQKRVQMRNEYFSGSSCDLIMNRIPIINKMIKSLNMVK